MSKHDEGFPQDLAPIVSRLSDKSRYADPLEDDQRKRRLLSRLQPKARKRTYLRSRIVTVLAVAGLVGGSGGAFAVAGGASPGSPASGQYGCASHDIDKGKCEVHPPRHCKKHPGTKACKKEEAEHDHHHS